MNWNSDNLAEQALLLVERQREVLRCMADGDYKNPIHMLCAGTRSTVEQLAKKELGIAWDAPVEIEDFYKKAS